MSKKNNKDDLNTMEIVIQIMGNGTDSDLADLEYLLKDVLDRAGKKQGVSYGIKFRKMQEECDHVIGLVTNEHGTQLVLDVSKIIPDKVACVCGKCLYNFLFAKNREELKKLSGR